MRTIMLLAWAACGIAASASPAFAGPADAEAPPAAAKVAADGSLIVPFELLGFGYSVDVAGDSAAVGAPLDVTQRNATGSVEIHRYDGMAWEKQAVVLPPVAASANDGYFGHAVAIDGDTLVVAAPTRTELAPTPRSGTGAVHVYTRTAGAWTLQQSLPAPADASGDVRFGWSVDVAGDTAVVGAPGANATYVFARVAGVWSQQAKLVAPLAGAFFGHAVAISGQSIAIGAPQTDPIARTTSGDGAVHVYLRNGANWTLQQTLATTSVLPGRGYAVDIDGDRLLAGASSFDQGCGAGIALYYTRTAGTWTQKGEFDAGTCRAAASVAIDGDVALVATAPSSGASRGVRRWQYSGAGDVWTRENQVGDLAQPVVALDGALFAIGTSLRGWEQAELRDVFSEILPFFIVAPEEDFAAAGRALAYDGSLLAIGDPGADVSGVTDAGIVHVFRLVGTAFVRLPVLQPPPGGSGGFGCSLAVHEGQVAVGACGASRDGAARAGRAYVYRYGAGSTTPAPLELVPATPAVDAAFGHAIAIDGPRVAVGAWHEGANAGAAYVFTLAGASYAQEQRLAFPGSFEFGAAIAIGPDRLLVGEPDGWRAHAYLRSGTAWALEKTIEVEDVFELGTGVALQGNRAVISGIGAGNLLLFDAQGSWPVLDQMHGNARAFAFAGNALVSSVPDPIGYVVDGDAFQALTDFSASATVVSLPPAIDSSRAILPLGDGRYEIFPTFRRQQLVDASGDPGDLLGASVAVCEDWLAVGVPGASGGAGRVQLYARSGREWVLQQTLPGAAGERYGTAVAMPDACAQVAIGAPAANGERGRVELRALGGTFALQQTLSPPFTLVGDQHGASVDFARNGAYVVTGAPGRNGERGIAYRFARGATQFDAPVDVELPVQQVGERFGAAVAIDATGAMLVGAPQHDGAGGADGGAAHLFRANAIAAPVEIVDPAGGAGDHFGAALDLDGADLVIGAPGADRENEFLPEFDQLDVGLLAFLRDDGAAVTRTQPDTLMNFTGERLGAAVAMRGGYALVGIPNRSMDLAAVEPADIQDGHVVRYRRSSSTGAWVADQFFNGPAGERSAFGSALALAPLDVIVGAPRHTEDGEVNRGRVHAYAIDDLFSFRDGFE